MTTLRALLLVAAALSCSNGRPGNSSDDSEAPMPPTNPATVVRRTTVRISPAQAGADLEGERGFLAMQRCAMTGDGRWLVCQLPPLEAGGPHRVATFDLTASSSAPRIEAGTLPPGGAAVIEGSNGARLPQGASLGAGPDPSVGSGGNVETTWYAPAGTPGTVVRLARIRGANRWALSAHQAAGGAPRWSVGAAEVPGDPLGVAIAPSGGVVHVAIAKPGAAPASELVALDAASGKVRWRAPIAATLTGLLLLSPDGAQLAVLARDPGRCQSCLRLVLVSPDDGRQAREIALPRETTAEDATSAGISGESVWFYRFVPEHRTSELAPLGRTPVRGSCSYEVYGLRGAGTPARTLRDAVGAWKDVAGGCAVRTLIPLAAGHVAAIQVAGENELTVVEFDAAP